METAEIWVRFAAGYAAANPYGDVPGQADYLLAQFEKRFYYDSYHKTWKRQVRGPLGVDANQR